MWRDGGPITYLIILTVNWLLLSCTWLCLDTDRQTNRETDWQTDRQKRCTKRLACVGITGQNTLQKVISTIFFLYFACLLPAIAFGVLYSKITAQQIGTSMPNKNKYIESQKIDFTRCGETYYLSGSGWGAVCCIWWPTNDYSFVNGSTGYLH